MVLWVRNSSRSVSVRLREWNDGWLGEAWNLVEPVELVAAGKKVGLDHDRVPAIDGFGPVTDELHGCSARNSGAFEVPHRRATQVMRHEAGNACRPTSTLPCAVQILNRLAVPAKEDPGHNLPGRAGKSVSLVLLRLQDTSESGDEWKQSPVTVLRFAR